MSQPPAAHVRHCIEQLHRVADDGFSYAQSDRFPADLLRAALVCRGAALDRGDIVLTEGITPDCPTDIGRRIQTASRVARDLAYASVCPPAAVAILISGLEAGLDLLAEPSAEAA